jgi:hypothetical protein
VKFEVEQLVEFQQLANFSLELVEGGCFDVKLESHDIFVVVPTKAQSKCMMRCKGKEQVEESNSFAKVIQK